MYTRVGTAGGYAHALRFAATHGWASYDIFFNDFIHLWSGVGRGNLNMAEIGNINRKKNKKAACPLGVPLKKEKVKSAMLQISLIYIIVEKMKEIAILNGQKNNQRHHLQKCNKVRLWLRMVEHRRFELLTPHCQCCALPTALMPRQRRLVYHGKRRLSTMNCRFCFCKRMACMPPVPVL